jgi:hypothetical protein
MFGGSGDGRGRLGRAQAIRTLLVAPLSEEFVFRACLAPLLLLQVPLLPSVMAVSAGASPPYCYCCYHYYYRCLFFPGMAQTTLACMHAPRTCTLTDARTHARTHTFPPCARGWAGKGKEGG